MWGKETCYNLGKGCYASKQQLEELNITPVEYEKIFGKVK